MKRTRLAASAGAKASRTLWCDVDAQEASRLGLLFNASTSCARIFFQRSIVQATEISNVYVLRDDIEPNGMRPPDES